MVLLIDGCVQSTNGATVQTIIQLLYSNQTVVSAAQHFKTLPTVQIEDGSFVLYVCQGEMAIVPSADLSRYKNVPRVLASDDATSCCIIVLSSEDYHIIGHLDCVQRVKSFFSEIGNLMMSSNHNPIKLHIIGGFHDRYGIADQTLTEIVGEVAFKSSNVYEVGVFCVGDLNLKPTDDKSLSGPAVLGISYDCLSTVIKPSKIGWSARNPLAVLRLSRLHCDSITQSIVSIFDYKQRYLVISPFAYSRYSLTRSPTISYEELRSHSTTPDHEPPSYFEGSAAMNRLMFYYPDPLKSWFKHGALKFTCPNNIDDINPESGKAWIPVDGQSAIASDHPIFALPLSK